MDDPSDYRNRSFALLSGSFLESKLLKTGSSKSESPGVELSGFIGHLEGYLQEADSAPATPSESKSEILAA